MDAQSMLADISRNCIGINSCDSRTASQRSQRFSTEDFDMFKKSFIQSQASVKTATLASKGIHIPLLKLSLST